MNWVSNKDYSGRRRGYISRYKASGKHVFSVQAYPIFFGAVKEAAKDAFQYALCLPLSNISCVIAET